MDEFKPINSQEELNNVIGERLRKERDRVTREFEQQISEKTAEVEQFRTDMEALRTQLDEANQKISGLPDLENKIRAYETASVKSKVAREVGIPFELAERLSGETEDDLRKDAEGLRKLIGAQKPTAPLAGSERDSGKNNNDTAWMKVVQDMKGE